LKVYPRDNAQATTCELCHTRPRDSLHTPLNTPVAAALSPARQYGMLEALLATLSGVPHGSRPPASRPCAEGAHHLTRAGSRRQCCTVTDTLPSRGRCAASPPPSRIAAAPHGTDGQRLSAAILRRAHSPDAWCSTCRRASRRLARSRLAAEHLALAGALL